jgi:hypothetical protein
MLFLGVLEQVMGARAVNAFLGLWLFLSAFLWPHPLPQLINAWMCGIFSVTIALAAIELDERARYLNVGLGIWLIVSSLIWRSSVTVVVNHVIVGVGLTVFGSLRRIAYLKPRFPG